MKHRSPVDTEHSGKEVGLEEQLWLGRLPHVFEIIPVDSAPAPLPNRLWQCRGEVHLKAASGCSEFSTRAGTRHIGLAIGPFWPQVPK
jgi:hypothetical protein